MKSIGNVIKMAFLRQYIYDLMNDRAQGIMARVITVCLSAISHIYGILVKWHYFFYKVNLLKSYKPCIGVVSVGNITLGGTGKTPFTIMLAERFARKNIKVAILIRGYGEDEWKVLENKLRRYDIKVFVARDRVKSVKEAEALGIDIVILDDGFQHRPLKRDIDIVLLDSTNPFGNRRLFPRGILREPISGLKMADILVLTKVDKAGVNSTMITDEIKKIAPKKTIIKAIHKPKALFDIISGKTEELTFINGRNVCIVSAICDPSYFRYVVCEAGALIGSEFVFPDHYLYRLLDIEGIFTECEKKNIKTIVTTEKDAVKLKSLRLPKHKARILALSVELAITEGEEKLNDGICGLYMRRSRKNT